MRSIKLCLIGRQRPRKVVVHPSGFAIVEVGPGRSSDLQSNAGAPKVTDVRMRNAFFIL